MPAEMPPNIVNPGADYRGAEQAPSRRFPFGPKKVRTKPTRADRRELERAYQTARDVTDDDGYDVP